MCIRNAYQCKGCLVNFPLPEAPSYANRLCTLLSSFSSNPGDPWKPQYIQPILCGHANCLRRTEGGYIACLNKTDSCFNCSQNDWHWNCCTRYIYGYCKECCEKRMDHADHPDYRPPELYYFNIVDF